MTDTASNNVISFDEYESARRKSGYGALIRALNDVRELCRQRLIENVRYMMTKCDDTLYGCAQLAESNIVQDLYLDAIHELKTVSGDLERLFINNFVEQFNLGIPRHIRQWNTSKPGVEPDCSDIPYLNKERASENIAVCKMIERTRGECAETLLSLDRRIGFLIRDPDLELWQNPLSPEPICEAFRAAVTEIVRRLKHGFEMRPVLFSLFDEYVLGDMDAVYKEVNLHLIRLGVQSQPHTNAHMADSSAGMPGYQDSLCPDNPVPQPEPDACFAPGQVAIQAESRFADNGAESGAQQASNSLALQQHGSGEPPLNQHAGKPGDITIDVVAMMFERILEDRSIADSMRALLGRLQIPFIKVANQAQRFFSDKKHPARLLLNRLADGARSWDEHLGHEDPLYIKIDTIVKAIADGVDQDASLFSTLLEDLEAFLGNREAQARKNGAGRSIKALEGEQPLEEARSKALEQIEEHIRGGLHPGNKPAELRTASEHEDAKIVTANAVVGSKTGNTQDRSPVGNEAGVDDIFITQARQLQPGTWIEIPGSSGKTKRIKLSWMSPITKTYLFTDQMGLNAGNYSIEELAQLLRSVHAMRQ